MRRMLWPQTVEAVHEINLSTTEDLMFNPFLKKHKEERFSCTHITLESGTINAPLIYFLILLSDRVPQSLSDLLSTAIM